MSVCIPARGRESHEHSFYFHLFLIFRGFFVVLFVVVVVASVVSDGRLEKGWKMILQREIRRIRIADLVIADLHEDQQQRHYAQARETRARDAIPSDG